jgi:outer membrane lipoprotein-sorting protein
MTLGTAVLAGTLLGGCAESEVLGLSGDEMIEKVVTAETEPVSYYAEGVLKIWTDDKLTNTMNIKEWVDGQTGRKRTETAENGNVSYALNNGTEILVYENETGTAYSMDGSAVGEQAQLTQKQQLVNQLERMRDSHEVKMMGQEELHGQDVIHIKLTPKEDGTLSLASEYWVDPKNWMVVKVTSTYGDNRSEVVYDPIQYNPEFTADTFTLDIPEGVEVKNMNDLLQSSEVTLEEAEAALGQPFLADAGGGLELSRIELYTSEGELSRDEVTLYYVRNNKVEVSLSVFKQPEGNIDEKLLPDESLLEIRGTQGSYIKSIRNISWDENGLRYSVMGENEAWTQEKLQAWANELKLSE